jgi:hypothetical protein
MALKVPILSVSHTNRIKLNIIFGKKYEFLILLSVSGTRNPPVFSISFYLSNCSKVLMILNYSLLYLYPIDCIISAECLQINEPTKNSFTAILYNNNDVKQLLRATFGLICSLSRSGSFYCSSYPSTFHI